MNLHALTALEFGRVRDELKEYCMSEYGRSRIDADEPSTVPEEIDSRLDNVYELRGLVVRTDPVAGSAFPDIDSAVAHATIEGTVLDPEQLNDIASFILSADSVRTSLRRIADDTRGDREIAFGEAADLERAIADVEIPTSAGRSIRRYIDTDGSIKEKEVPELQRISRAIRNAQNDIRTSAAAILQDPKLRGSFTSDIPTLRNGRTVLPVHVNFRGRIPGMVHEVSDRGSTAFVEPPQLVERNNRLVELDQEYRQALVRLLRELTSHVREVGAQIQALTEVVAYLDAVYARARYSLVRGCNRATTRGRTIRLRGARHPSLGRSAVPIDITMGEATGVLVITGPNTGGKTVALKTIGLFALMNQFGMEVPADEIALPVFDDIFADIGDEQSIEQSLSTFSGHMKVMAEILDKAGDGSLVLLDELGAGTDPEEGSALALAVLRSLHTRGTRVIATTHHGALKEYAYSEEGVENAAVEFDEQALSPTYRILTGVPGASHAIAVAARMGIPAEIIGEAKRQLHEELTDTAHIVRRLVERQAEVATESAELRRRDEDLRRREEALAAERRRMEAREEALRQAKIRDVDTFAAEARSKLENLVREIREGELTRERRKAVKEFAGEVSAGVESLRRPAPTDAGGRRSDNAESGDPGDQPEFAEGARVRIQPGGTVGEIVRELRGGKFLIETGSMRVVADRSDVSRIDADGADVPAGSQSPAPAPGTAASGPTTSGSPERSNAASPRKGEPSRKSRRPSVHVEKIDDGGFFEIDVRGMRRAEAIEKVDRRLDQAILSGETSVGIIHGKGTGVLQQAIRELLTNHPSVTSFAFARPELGGSGKTIAELGR